MADNVTVVAGAYTAVVASDDVGSVQYQRVKVTWGPGGTANDVDAAAGSPLPVQIRTSNGDLAMDDSLDAVKVTVAASGVSNHYYLSTGTIATNVKNSSAILYGLSVTNTNASARYLKLYNSTGTPTVGTTTLFSEYLIPGSTAGGGHSPNLPADGIAFTSGLAYGLATGAGTSTGAPSAGEIIVTLQYT